MNEEIKKQPTVEEINLRLSTRGFLDVRVLPLLEDHVKKIKKDAYLQGAKDMWEAVKREPIKERKNFDIYEICLRDAYNYVVNEIDFKAQQFIDSLEKGTTNE